MVVMLELYPNDTLFFSWAVVLCTTLFLVVLIEAVVSILAGQFLTVALKFSHLKFQK